MKNFKNSFFYICIIGVFSSLMYYTVLFGRKLERDIVLPTNSNSEWENFLQSLFHNIQHPLALLLAQIVTIILVARIVGWFFKKIGQPSVIGEIIAGIVLGPSLLGMYFPEFSESLFPVASLGNLQFLSQIGLILFMFVIGMELDLKVLKNKAHDAVVISHASIILPFALGMGLAYFIYTQFAPKGVQFLSFALFLGIAMSITAFPVLARIVQERGLQKTKLGTIVITCAAADDITAWCLLAVVIAIVKAGSFVSALYTIAVAAIYVLVMIKFVKPFLKRVGDLHQNKESLSKPIVALFFIVLIISAYATEVIGIHALFGAFMAGAIMPEKASFRNIFIEKVEDVALVLLLPLFFVFTGLRTQIGLLDDVELWKITGLIILVAVIGKFVGSALTARFVGQKWSDSLIIGALMNTRGLMELVVLNIGYDLGVLDKKIFTMMVIMALATTLMTGPLLDLINWLFKVNDSEVAEEIVATGKYKILVSFGNIERGKSLLKIANGLTKKVKENSLVTVMHLAKSDEIHHFNVEEYEDFSFDPIIKEAEELNQKITTFYKVSNNIEQDIAEVANDGNFDLLLIGVGQSIYEGSLLGKILGFTTRIINPEKLINQVTGKENLFENSIFDDRTKSILSACNTSVGVFVDKGFNKMDSIIIPIFQNEDIDIILFAKKFIKNASSQITILDVEGNIKNTSEIKELVRVIEQIAPNHIQLISNIAIDETLLQQHDLMMVNISCWKKLIDQKIDWLPSIPSTIILSK